MQVGVVVNDVAEVNIDSEAGSLFEVPGGISIWYSIWETSLLG